MKYEVSKKKRILAVFIVVVLMLCFGLFIKNRANTLSNSSINKESVTKELNNNLIGAYIQEGEEYIQTDNIPISGYEFNSEESYCKIGDTIQEDITLFYDMDTQTLTVSPITKEGMKCYLYFDEKASAGDTILASESAPTNSTTDWTGGTTYYYTGNPNNWVQFGELWWRIIRINGDGTIRMIYQGTSANETGTGTQIGTSAFNSSSNNNMYVGYMYQSGQLHGLQQSSTIKGVLDNWYTTYIENDQSSVYYGQYIDRNAGFCGDRTPSTSPNSSDGSGGTGTTEAYYGAYIRLISNTNPSLQCDSRDVYTTTDSSSGNKSLQYPIGLVTADEVVLAGGSTSSEICNYYLCTGQDYWTMSPAHYYSAGAYMFIVYYFGRLDGIEVSFRPGVRPVINLRSDVQITGSGTVSDPFKVVGAS